MKDPFRIAQRQCPDGSDIWLVKQADGWRVAHRCKTLQEAADWLTAQGADISLVPVSSSRWPWPMLSQLIAAVPAERRSP
jgi:hypothetical protein